MTLFRTLIDIFLHLDKQLSTIISSYGMWTYGLLFLIIFCETGLVVTPFLPGDSLLFAAGTFAALKALNIVWLLFLLAMAAILGDTVNYWIGRKIGPKAFSGRIRFLNQQHLARTQAFFEKYGGKAIVIGRFMPIIRTFMPFVAGVGAMKYQKFIFYNIAGGLLWVFLFTLAGYFFGNIPMVKENFTIVILVIIAISICPAFIQYFLDRRRKRGLSTIDKREKI